MLKVILIDDEPIILEGLKKIIDWNELGYEIIYTAKDGIDGFEQIIKLKPDVALIDIRIPGIDGLNLIEKIRMENLNTKVIILSGYSEFSYAQKAIELGVEAYLLKPIDANLLIEKLNRLKLAIFEENKFKEDLSSTIRLTKDKVLEMILNGQFNETNIDIMNKWYGFDFPWDIYQVAIVQPVGYDYFYSNGYLISERINQLKDYIDTYLKKNDIGCSIIVNNKICILFKNFWYPLNSRSIDSFKKRMIYQFKEEFIISIGSEVNELEQIHRSYLEANMILEKRFLHSYKGILYFKDLQQINVQNEITINQDYYEKLSIAIELNGFDKINQIIEDVAQHMMTSGLDEEEIKINFSNLFINTLYKISKDDYKKEIVQKYLSQQVLKNLYIQKSLIELKSLVKYYMLSVADEISKSNPDNIKNKIITFIQQNYQSNIKLEIIADAFGYNSSYFSKLFKKMFGENYTTYLDKIRIEKAKAFLLNGYKVYEVAKKVGYDDTDYFCSKFKKYVGKSPKEYKEKSNI